MHQKSLKIDPELYEFEDGRENTMEKYINNIIPDYILHPPMRFFCISPNIIIINNVSPDIMISLFRDDKSIF